MRQLLANFRVLGEVFADDQGICLWGFLRNGNTDVCVAPAKQLKISALSRRCDAGLLMCELKHTPHISVTVRDNRCVAAVKEYLEANVFAALRAFQDAEIAIFDDQY